MRLRKKDTPLTIKIENGLFTIQIGIDTLAWAFDHLDSNNPYKEIGPEDEFGDRDWDFVQEYKVVDSEEFAKDVARIMQREEEDGSTPLSNFLDKMCNAAVDYGSIGVEESGEVIER
jgi:hypothetical protein